MESDLDEVIDLVYIKIHNFLTARLDEDLNEDIIDIDIQHNEKGEIEINIDVSIEVLPFINENLDEIVEEAIRKGMNVADKHCPKFVIRPKS